MVGRRSAAAHRGHRVRTFLQILFFAGLITVGSVFYVWQRYQYIRLGFEVAALRQTLTQEEKRLEPLEVEVDYLSRPERIDLIARQQLGLRAPSPSQIVLVEQDVPLSDSLR